MYFHTGRRYLSSNYFSDGSEFAECTFIRVDGTFLLIISVTVQSLQNVLSYG